MMKNFSADGMLLKTAEYILNLKLQGVPSLNSHLSELEGKLIGLEVEPIALQLLFAPQRDRLKVLNASSRTPDVWIRGTAINLAKASRAAAKTRVHLDISGDVEVGQSFQRLLRQSELDWEELLSLWIGDVAAYWIGTGLRRAAAGFGRAVNSLEVSIGDYLLEENKVLVYAREISDFVSRVDDLRHAVDRLEARIKKLTAEAV